MYLVGCPQSKHLDTQGPLAQGLVVKYLLLSDRSSGCNDVNQIDYYGCTNNFSTRSQCLSNMTVMWHVGSNFAGRQYNLLSKTHFVLILLLKLFWKIWSWSLLGLGGYVTQCVCGLLPMARSPFRLNCCCLDGITTPD